MASIYEIPVETLEEILSFIQPGDFEAFALSCRDIYTRSHRYIEPHNKMMKKWRHRTAPAPISISVFGLLLEIARDPIVAQYIESLDLDPLVGRWPRDLDRLTEDHGAKMEEIKELVRGAAFLKGANVNWTEWWDHLRSEERSARRCRPYLSPYSVLTLIALLPNLKELSLPRSWDRVGEMVNLVEAKSFLPELPTKVVDAIVTWSSKGLKGDQPLGRLKVILPPKDRYERMPRYFQGFQPFMALQSVREVYAANWIIGAICVQNETFETNIFRYSASHPPSSITRLELASCHLDASSISDILRHTPLLRVFRYSHDSKIRLWSQERDFNPPEWNPKLFNDAVSAHCGQTIVDFALTQDNLHYDYSDDAISSLRCYPNLKVLEIDVRMFADKSVKKNKHGIEGPAPPRPLVSMLPNTITEVHLNIALDKHGVLLKPLLRNLEKSCENELTNLETFVLREHRCGRSAREMAKKHTMLTLESYGEGLGVLDRLDAMPAWKRENLQRTKLSSSEPLE